MLKQNTSRELREYSVEGHFWQERYYDFNVWSEEKRVEKLRYIHRNPVKRGLVETPEQWAWSSFRFYAYGEKGLVRVNFQEWPLEIKRTTRQSFGDGEQSVPTHLHETPMSGSPALVP